jgi:hypothetical protein
MVISLIGSALAVIIILLHYGKPRFSVDLLCRRLVEGVEFAFAYNHFRLQRFGQGDAEPL